MVRYHLGLDAGATRGKRIRPLLGLLAYQSISGDYERALPGAAAVELGHNFSLVHDDIEDGGTERRKRAGAVDDPGRPAGDQHRRHALLAVAAGAAPPRGDGLSAAKILQLMRLYDDTCLALCEGQFMDIWTSEHDDWISVDYYFDMIGRKTASLIAGAIQAAAMLATEDAAIVAAYRELRLGRRDRVPAQRRPARHLGRGSDDRQGAVRHRHAQADAAGDLRDGARRPDDRERLRDLLRHDTRLGRESTRRTASWSAPARASTSARQARELPGRGTHPARIGRRRGQRGPGSAARHRALRHQRLRRSRARCARAQSSDPSPRSPPASPARCRTASTLPTRRPSVVSTVSVSTFSTSTVSPTLGMPPTR